MLFRAPRQVIDRADLSMVQDDSGSAQGPAGVAPAGWVAFLNSASAAPTLRARGDEVIE
jgi:hypothetical protein